MNRCNGFENGECQMRVGDREVCGETGTLAIINEFKQLYEDKMKEVDGLAGEDCLGGLQLKMKIQQQWIKDLTEQNEMLVRVVEELEQEATTRVTMLEEKLQHSARCGVEVMQKYRDFNFSINLDETFQKLACLQSDVRNLLEYIRRLRDEGTHNIDGLHFYDVTYADLFGNKHAECECTAKKYKMAEKLHEKEKEMRELLQQMAHKDEEHRSLKRSMVDMRNALTVEVAEKHDTILNLRREVQQLEEQYRQSNKQTQFKDDIIKEMRKEIKMLKSKIRSASPKSQSVPTRMPEHSLPSPTNHVCCPYVKELCPLHIQNMKQQKVQPKLGKSGLTTTNSNNKTFIFIQELNENSPTHDYSTITNDNTNTPKNTNEDQLKQLCINEVDKPPTEMSSCNVTPVPYRFMSGIHFHSEGSLCVKGLVKKKPRSALTATRILHEYYGTARDSDDSCGIVENYKEAPTHCSTVNVPRHIPVRMFVNNLEKKVPEKTAENEIKKKIPGKK